MKSAVLGLRARTGRAIAVVLSADSDSPAFVWRGMLSLVDPKIPATAEPYHEVMELPWNEACVAVKPLVTAIETTAADAIRAIVADMRSRKIHVRAAGIVGSPPRSLDRIGNEHIRGHAAEGILFRQVLEHGAKENGLAHQAFSDRDLRERVAALTAPLAEMGRAAGSPWRIDEKLAATAAWMAIDRRF